MNSLVQVTENVLSQYAPPGDPHSKLFSAQQDKQLKDVVILESERLSEQDKKRIWQEFFEAGPISELIRRQGVFDIIIQGHNNIFYEDQSGIHQWQDQFLSIQSFQLFFERLLRESKMLVNQKHPFCNGKWQGFRVHIASPPITPQLTITLRKQGRGYFSFDEMVSSDFLGTPQSQWFQKVVDDKKNMLIIGPTGSGKTTFLNSLLQLTPISERVIILEDTDEIQLNRNQCCKMLTRETATEQLPSYQLSDLLKQALRMRPDRIVVGEVRDKEAKDLLQALATGHSGSMGTLHAHSAKQALLRLEMLVQMGAPQWSIQSVRQLILLSLDYLVVLKESRQKKGIKEIYKLTSVESFGILIEEIHF